MVAYRTVEAPADPARRVGGGAEPVAGPAVDRLPDPLPNPLPNPAASMAPSMAPADLAARLEAGRIDAVLLSSPSIARRFAALAPAPPAAVALLAIGRSTAAELQRLGLPPAATVSLPTPAGLADAWETALAARAEPLPGTTGCTPAPPTTPPNRPTEPSPPAKPTPKEPT